MKKVTLVFYEYPAAKHHIDEWEEQQQQKIKDKVVNEDDNTVFYYLEDEILYCHPINDFSIELIGKLISHKNDKKYHKTLIFGRVEMNQLEKIQRLIQYILQPEFILP